MSQTELDNIFNKVMDNSELGGVFHASEHFQLKSVAMAFLREALNELPPTQEQFNKIEDLRPYLANTSRKNNIIHMSYLSFKEETYTSTEFLQVPLVCQLREIERILLYVNDVSATHIFKVLEENNYTIPLSREEITKLFGTQ